MDVGAVGRVVDAVAIALEHHDVVSASTVATFRESPRFESTASRRLQRRVRFGQSAQDSQGQRAVAHRASGL